MLYEIIWTAKAEKQYYDLFDYLFEKWSADVAIDFTVKLNNLLSNLELQPFIGQVSVKDKRVRMIIVTPHNALYYQIEKSRIFLLSLVDTRQDPVRPKY